MKRYLSIFILLILLIAVKAYTQTSEPILEDKTLIYTDTVIGKVDTTDSLKFIADTAKKAFKPDPVRVVWMGAILPGYGQILNRKYWKLPIVYGGFLGCAYAISMNSGKYETYKTAYRDIIDTDPNTNSFMEIIPDGYTIENLGGINAYTNILKTGQNGYKRYRDLSIIFSIAYYGLTLVDAFVDAQLYDFDISPDLSLRLQPTLIDNVGMKKQLGMQCCFILK